MAGKRAIRRCLLVGLPEVHHYYERLIRLKLSYQEVVSFPFVTKQTGS